MIIGNTTKSWYGVACI